MPPPNATLPCLPNRVLTGTVKDFGRGHMESGGPTLTMIGGYPAQTSGRRRWRTGDGASMNKDVRPVVHGFPQRCFDQPSCRYQLVTLNSLTLALVTTAVYCWSPKQGSIKMFVDLEVEQ